MCFGAVGPSFGGMADSRRQLRVPRGRRSAVVVVVLALSFGGCGASHKSTTSQSTSSTSTATTTSTSPKKAAANHARPKPGKARTKPTTATHATTTTTSAPGSASNTHTTTTSHPMSASAPRPSSAAPVLTRPIHATLRGQNHAPKVNAGWSYSIAVTDAKGHPLSGTVDIEFALGGQVVGHDTPPTHPLTKGRWHDVLTFPAASIGVPLAVQAVVHTSLGSTTLDWPVKVHR